MSLRGGAGPRRREKAEVELEVGKRITGLCGGCIAGLVFGFLPARSFLAASAWGSPSVCGVCMLDPLSVYIAVASLWPGAGKLTTLSGRAEGSC